jgi:hypothetical protein
MMKNDTSHAARWGLGLAAAGLLAAGTAMAEGPDYTYAQLGYINVDVDDVDVDGDGFSLAGSVAITDLFHLFGSYDDGELDSGPVDVDLSRLRLGGGLNFAITPTTDLVGTLYYVNYELDGPGPGDVDEDGFGITGGIRSMVTPALELNGAIRYEDLGGDVDDETSLLVGGVYSFTPAVAAYASAEFGDDITEFGVGIRVYFGKL